MRYRENVACKRTALRHRSIGLSSIYSNIDTDYSSLDHPLAEKPGGRPRLLSLVFYLIHKIVT